ncbi:MAG TPA: N-acetyltransferase [Thermomicrobiales bacterium]|nr:N-acetyltransferase [Thermomicrobiales bacterium]
MSVVIRAEQPADIASISRLTEIAFRDHEHSGHTEQFIVDGLRRAGVLTLSLVAVDNDSVVGHVAVSPVIISSGETGWFGLGPISVLPERQRQGIGSQLMHAALADLRQLDAKGCVVLGDPGYYGRFGFRAHPGLELPGVPVEYFQAVSFGGVLPAGTVRYHDAFDAAE